MFGFNGIYVNQLGDTFSRNVLMLPDAFAFQIGEILIPAWTWLLISASALIAFFAKNSVEIIDAPSRNKSSWFDGLACAVLACAILVIATNYDLPAEFLYFDF